MAEWFRSINSDHKTNTNSVVGLDSRYDTRPKGQISEIGQFVIYLCGLCYLSKFLY